MSESWALLLPYRNPPLSGNDRGHTRAMAAAKAEVRRAGWAVAKRARLPKLQAVIAEIIYYPGNNRRRDGINLAPTMKVIMDGIVSAGVLPDDDAERVIRESQRVVYRRDDPYDQATPRLVLVLTDASAMAPLPHYGPEELL